MCALSFEYSRMDDAHLPGVQLRANAAMNRATAGSADGGSATGDDGESSARGPA
ncbi:hypothetical protein MTP03_33970 [Tsukamurella sp. PLM1]|nr:hypothetical protein MTP03_33970 [Tsukamurella sp. PLM1]